MPVGPLCRLLRRAEFLAVAGTGRKSVMPGLIVQVRPQPAGSGIRYGLTASRKVGGAVERNRARRRLRALAEAVLPAQAGPDADYVLIARPATPSRPFTLLHRDLAEALARLGR